MKITSFARRLFKTSGDKPPVVCIFGLGNVALVTPRVEDYEEARLDCRCYPSDSGLEGVLVRDKPRVLITVGKRSAFPNVVRTPFEIRKRWLHYDAPPETAQLGRLAYDHYLRNLFDDGKDDEEPLVMVFAFVVSF